MNFWHYFQRLARWGLIRLHYNDDGMACEFISYYWWGKSTTGCPSKVATDFEPLYLLLASANDAYPIYIYYLWQSTLVFFLKGQHEIHYNLTTQMWRWLFNSFPMNHYNVHNIRIRVSLSTIKMLNISMLCLKPIQRVTGYIRSETDAG